METDKCSQSLEFIIKKVIGPCFAVDVLELACTTFMRQKALILLSSA